LNYQLDLETKPSLFLKGPIDIADTYSFSSLKKLLILDSLTKITTDPTGKIPWHVISCIMRIADYVQTTQNICEKRIMNQCNLIAGQT